ncbi:VQ motif-containing protein 22 [Cocos nucifera]|nr:VQ motif-containing protein 22 [Cocos nucifera]
MAMSDTSSVPPEWAQLYGQHGLGTHPAATPAMLGHMSAVADSTVVTTSSSPTIAGSSSSPTSHPVAIEGRVGKSGRRRSRASRRAPTTLLNTDTTNFRAMVQQFTGIPSGPYSSSYQPSNRPMINFGLNFNDPLRQATVVPFGHLQQQQQQHQAQSFQHQHEGHHYQPQQQQQHHQSYDGTMFEGNHNMFLQGFSNPGANLEVTDGFFLEGMTSQMMPRTNSTDTRTNGFFS